MWSGAIAGAHTPTGNTDAQGAQTHNGLTQGHVRSTAELPAHSHEQQPGLRRRRSDVERQPGSSVNDAGMTTHNIGSGFAHTHGHPRMAEGAVSAATDFPTGWQDYRSHGRRLVP